MPDHVIGKLMQALNTRRKSVAGSKVLSSDLPTSPMSTMRGIPVR